MDQDKGAELSEIAVELYYLREEAKAACEPFLAYLIGMAAKEAARMGGEPKPDRPKPQLVRGRRGGEAGRVSDPAGGSDYKSKP